MNTRMKLGLLLGMLAIILIGWAVAGCNTIDGVGRDLQIAARSTAETER